MTHNEKLLCSIHRAAEMGRDSLARVLQSVQNDHFRNLLADWQETYSRYYISADVLLTLRWKHIYHKHQHLQHF